MASTIDNRHNITETKTIRVKLFSSQWWVPAGLLILMIIPTAAGIYRISQLVSNADITPENIRFFEAPEPVTIHIIGFIVYAILGAFQFAPRFRIKHPRFHRRIGLLILPFGLATALSGLWMTIFYDLPPHDGELLYAMRMFVGVYMTTGLLLGYYTFRRRDFVQHGKWMIRAYAIGLGAGTQVLTNIPWVIVKGSATPDVLSRAIIMGAGWTINFILAEWIIQKRLTSPKRMKR